MSHSDLSFDDDEEGYHLDDASSTTSMDSDDLYEMQMTANYLLVQINICTISANPNSLRNNSLSGEIERLNLIWERQKELGLLHRFKCYERCEVLDLGTGTGNWAITFAEAFPLARVIGFDLYNIQTDQVPENLHWELGDLHIHLSYKDNRFDLIRVSHLDGCVQRWDEFLKEVYRMLKPGGYIEVQDYCLTIVYGESRDVGFIRSFINDLERAANRRGTPLNMAPRHSLHLRNSGFKDVILEKLRIDVHDNMDLIRRTFKAYATGLLASGTFPPEVIARAAIAANQLQKGDYLILYRLCAQKPSQNKPNSLLAKYCRPGAHDFAPSRRAVLVQA